MKFIITLNGVKVEKEIPTSWDKVSFRKFLELSKDDTLDELKTLSIFTGIETDTLRKAKIFGLESVLAAISFTRSQILTPLPKTILGYDVPKDLGFETMGQYIDLKDELDKGKKGMELIQQFPLFCAIYTMKEYDFKLAEKRAEQFLDAPCTEVMGVGNFILMKLAALRLTTEASYLKAKATRRRRWLLALLIWLKNMAFTVRYYFWKRKLRLTEMK